MLPTIILFLALLITLGLINDFISPQNDHKLTTPVIRLIFCVLWSWLFYLLY